MRPGPDPFRSGSEAGKSSLSLAGDEVQATSTTTMASPAPLINQDAPDEIYFHHSPSSTDPLSVYLHTTSVTMATMV